MPEITVIDGIRIVMYWDDHSPPHFHAWNGSLDGMFDLQTGLMIKGRLDRRTIRKVEAWARNNQAFLQTEWTRCQTGSKGTTK